MNFLHVIGLWVFHCRRKFQLSSSYSCWVISRLLSKNSILQEHVLRKGYYLCIREKRKIYWIVSFVQLEMLYQMVYLWYVFSFLFTLLHHKHLITHILLFLCRTTLSFNLLRLCKSGRKAKVGKRKTNWIINKTIKKDSSKWVCFYMKKIHYFLKIRVSLTLQSDFFKSI